MKADLDKILFDREQIANCHVFPGLGHHAFVGGHHQQYEIDASCARYHSAYKLLVAGDVNYGDLESSVEFEDRKAEVDGDPARFFFGKSVGVDAGQCANQAGLAMIDVARSPEHQRRRLRLVAFLVSAAQWSLAPCRVAEPWGLQRCRPSADEFRAR